MNIDTMNFGSVPVRKEKFNVGDVAYIIESNRIIRTVTIIKRNNSFCTVRFADSDGAISVRESRLYRTKELAEEAMPKKKKEHAGPRPPHRIW